MGRAILNMVAVSIFSSGINAGGYSQSCCSGCVPISNNLGLPLSEKNTVQVALSYDLNLLNTLKDGSANLNDKARKRLTHSILLQGGYVFTNKWSAELFLSWVRQERIIKQFDNTSKTIAQGLGDAVILIKYKLHSSQGNRINWLIGAGPKFPTGAADRSDKNDIALNADLQPGSGSLDAIAWKQFSKNSNKRPTLTWSGTATFSLKGKNKKYLGSQVYQFGNELIFITGMADQFVTNQFLWGASLQAVYRLALQDENDGEKTPGTGGQWIFIRPGITIKPGGSSAINISASVPAYSWVRDAQLTPTVRFNVGYYFEVSPKKTFNNSLKQ